MEIWKPVVGFEDYYEVSDSGEVRSFDRLCNGRSGSTPLRKGRVLKQMTAPNGYKKVSLTKPGTRIQRNIHVLVCEAFIGPRPTGFHILHGDGDQNNNSLENLRYGSVSENQEDKKRHGTFLTGETYPSSLVTDETALEIRRFLDENSLPHREVSEMFDTTISVVRNIRYGRTYKHLWV